MNDQDFQRILAAVDGYWGVELKGNARKAWRHSLGAFTADAALAALEDYANQGHPFPPRPGQLASLIGIPRETERDRCRRQRKTARQYVAQGVMTQRDFDFYEETYWLLHDPQNRKAQAA